MKKQILIMIVLLNNIIVLNAQTISIINDWDVSFKLKVFECWIESKIAYEDWPGLSIGIVYDQELIWSKGFGYANMEKKIPSTVYTKYFMASNTKQFTAIAIMQLRDAGKIDLNDPVEKYLPWINEIKQPFNNVPKITIRNLLTHTSGLPMDGLYLYCDDCILPALNELIEKLKYQTAAYPPETRWKYSNLEFAILGEIVSKVSGIPYTNYIKKYILDPLNMTETYISDTALILNDLAIGYGRKMPGNKRATFTISDLNALTPAAGLISSLMDLSKYVKWQFRIRDTDRLEIIKGSTLREMQNIQWLDPGWKMGWGYGFLLTYKDPFYIVNHGGHWKGFRTEIATMKNYKICIICLANADDIILYADLPLSVTSNIFEWVIPEIISAIKKGELNLKQDNFPDYSKYEGKYRSMDNDRIIISRKGELVLIDPRSSNPLSSVDTLKFVSDSNFLFESEDGFSNTGEILTFHKNDKGEIESYLLGEDVYKKISNW